MLWSPSLTYELEPFEQEQELEKAILAVQNALFGPSRVYLDVKKRSACPAAFVTFLTLIRLTSVGEGTRLYVVENELAKHDPLKHIAVQILQFSLSFETTPQRVKDPRNRWRATSR